MRKPRQVTPPGAEPALPGEGEGEGAAPGGGARVVVVVVWQSFCMWSLYISEENIEEARLIREGLFLYYS